jgi:hypothetical protein
VAHGPQPLLSEVQALQGVELMDVRVGDVGEVGAEQNAVTEPGEPGQGVAGNGMRSSAKSVNAIVVSSRTWSYRSARPRNSSYSGIPRCATTSRSVGCRASTRAIGWGPVCLPGAGPDPQWITTGIRASASNPQAYRRSSSAGS